MVSRIAAKDKAIKIMLDKAAGQTKAISHIIAAQGDAEVAGLYGLKDCSQGDAKVAAHPKGVYV